jgi:Mg-chelatase subunit ChlD
MTASPAKIAREEERLRRWRLVLGGGKAEGTGVALEGRDGEVDAALSALYDSPPRDPKDTSRRKKTSGGLNASAPRVARWLGEIRRLFPSSTVQVLQRDALDRLGIERMLLEPELLELVHPDVNLAATLLALRSAIPARSKELVRKVVRRVVRELMQRLDEPMRQAVTGSLQRSERTRRPRPGDIDWNRTILRNLRHYQPQSKTIVPEKWVGFGRRHPALRDIILCVDQSGSMGSSLIYSCLYAGVLASIPALRTRLVVFDTAVVDLTDQLREDPVDLLLGVQLGGGTDIEQALRYCAGLVTRPEDTVLVLLSDLFEGASRHKALRHVAGLVQRGVQVISLLALDDEGQPSHDQDFARSLASMGVACFACTPDRFPDLMAEALAKHDVTGWASRQGIFVARGS